MIALDSFYSFRDQTQYICCWQGMVGHAWAGVILIECRAGGVVRSRQAAPFLLAALGCTSDQFGVMTVGCMPALSGSASLCCLLFSAVLTLPLMGDVCHSAGCGMLQMPE